MTQPRPSATAELGRQDANRAYCSYLTARACPEALIRDAGDRFALYARGVRTIPGTRLPQIAADAEVSLRLLRDRHPDLSEDLRVRGLSAVAAGLRDLRYDARLTVAELAEAAGVRAVDIRAYESGTRQPGPTVGPRVLAGLGVTPAAFSHRYPDAGDVVASWPVLAAESPRYFAMPAAALSLQVWARLAAGDYPPGLFSRAPVAGADAPSPVARLDVRLHRPAGSGIRGLVAAVLGAVGSTAWDPEGWAAWLPASGRLYPTPVQRATPIRAGLDVQRPRARPARPEPGVEVSFANPEVTRIRPVRAEVRERYERDLAAYEEALRHPRSPEAAGLVGPGQDLLVCGDGGVRYAVRVLAAHTEHTGTIAVDPVPTPAGAGRR